MIIQSHHCRIFGPRVLVAATCNVCETKRIVATFSARTQQPCHVAPQCVMCSAHTYVALRCEICSPHIHQRQTVCMHVCMYVCVCMHVCVYDVSSLTLEYVCMNVCGVHQTLTSDCCFLVIHLPIYINAYIRTLIFICTYINSSHSHVALLFEYVN